MIGPYRRRDGCRQRAPGSARGKWKTAGWAARESGREREEGGEESEGAPASTRPGDFGCSAPSGSGRARNQVSRDRGAGRRGRDGRRGREGGNAAHAHAPGARPAQIGVGHRATNPRGEWRGPARSSRFRHEHAACQGGAHPPSPPNGAQGAVSWRLSVPRRGRGRSPPVDEMCRNERHGTPTRAPGGNFVTTWSCGSPEPRHGGAGPPRSCRRLRPAGAVAPRGARLRACELRSPDDGSSSSSASSASEPCSEGFRAP
jgi:hypothetical protein